MNYFNFFEGAQEEKKALNIPMICGCLAAIVFLVLGGMYLMEKEKNLAAQQDLQYLLSISTDKDFKKQLSQVSSLKKLVTSAENDLAMLGTAEWLVGNRTTVNADVITQIMTCFGTRARVTAFNISNRSVSLEGVAMTMADVISVETALVANSDYFRNVFVSSVKHDGRNGENSVSFSMTFTLKEVQGQ